MNEIDRDFYCYAGRYKNGFCINGGHVDYKCKGCSNKHRKHPTPEQFKQEYGYEFPDEGAAWMLIGDEWCLGDYAWLRDVVKVDKDKSKIIVCACTPWDKPDEDWRP